MKEKMTRWFRYTAEDVKAAQAELDELAEQGWELTELGIFTASFRRAEQPRRCWVEPARWTSIRRKDEQARTDYLALCEEAGWDLVDEAGGLFYFQAQPDTNPLPIQTDGSLEWEDVLKKSLWNQAYTFFYLVVYWVAWAAGRFFLDQPRVWEMFFSNGAMLVQLLLLLWLAVNLYLGFRVVRYRKKCRRAAEAGKPMPEPGRKAARFRGAVPLVYILLGAAIILSFLLGFDSKRYNLEEGWLTTERSVLGESAEYREFSEKGDLWLESYDCKISWLVGTICGDLRAIEGDENRLHRYFHYHGPVELTETDLGYDQAWSYTWGGGNGLIFRQGNRVVHMEAEKLDLTDRAVVDGLLDWLDQAACAAEENMIA